MHTPGHDTQKGPANRRTPQGMQEPNLKGLRVGDTAVLDSPEHGKILIKIPERAELEERQFELELERMKGRPAYLEPDDLGVMYGLLLGDIDRYRD